MNILEVQEALKDMSQNQLIQEATRPSGVAPSFMVVSELKRRQDMRQRYQNQAPKMTVADEVVGRSVQPMMPQPMQQQMPMQQPMMQPEMAQPMMQQPMMQQEPRRMFMGGLARLLGAATRGTRRVPSPTTSQRQQVVGPGATVGRTGVAPQSGGTNLPMAPINPSQLPVPYVPPTRTQRGINALKGFGRTALGATPFGLGAYAMMPDTMGDGTMAGRFGLTEEDYELLVQEAEKRGVTPYDERFGDFVESYKKSQQPMSREEMIAQMQQQEEGEAAERPKSYIEQLMENVEQREERARRLGLAQLGLEISSRAGEGKPFLTSISEAGLAALPQFQRAGDARTKMLASLAEAEMKARAGGANVKDLIDYRNSLMETLNDPLAASQMTEAQKEQLRSRLSEIDARIQLNFGISPTAGGGQQDLGALIQQALQARQQS